MLILLTFQITQSLESQVSKLSNTTTTHTNTSASDSNHSMYDNLNNGKNKRDYATQKGKTSEPDLLGDLNNLNNPSALQTVHGDFRLPSKQLDFPDVNVHFSRPSLPLMPMKAASAFGQLDFPDVNVHFSRPSLPLMPMKAASAFGHVTTRRDSLDGQSYQKRSKQMAFRMTPVPFPSQKMKNLKWIKLQDSIVGKCNGFFIVTNVIPSILSQFIGNHYVMGLFTYSHHFSIECHPQFTLYQVLQLSS